MKESAKRFLMSAVVFGALAVAFVLFVPIDWTNEWGRDFDRHCKAQDPSWAMTQVGGRRHSEMWCARPDGTLAKPKWLPGDLTADQCEYVRNVDVDGAKNYASKTHYPSLTYGEARQLCNRSEP